ncbi:GNAT family N-acetyltransferase [Burkholderia diffusa]|uniref:GNAT family N-acetyltransferase n=1 Tax=Burkholderia diffusa TaxID=488732 RepID=UPI0019397EA6|nr:GNAT family N-acetyltransferase [Burkholderia diffusa]MBM2650941.1 GNAT family N-acetyltransferase [Burkholderia diffusa]
MNIGEPENRIQSVEVGSEVETIDLSSAGIYRMFKNKLLCNHTQQEIECEISCGFNIAYVFQADSEWGQEKAKIIQQLLDDNPGAQGDLDKLRELLRIYNLEDWHWEWSRKAFDCKGPQYEWFYMIAEGRVQGIAIIYHPEPSRVNGDDIFYIDYLATARWNRPRPGYQKQFSQVGSLLLAHCIDFAVNVRGYRPGFCLHSLPNAEAYYVKIGMTDFGLDPEKENLRFFEAKEDAAIALMGGANG